MIDSNYPLEEIDFIQFIEATKTIIEITDTLNTCARQISNYSFFIPQEEMNNHNTFVINFRAIYMRPINYSL
jgi:hypothetical protein